MAFPSGWLYRIPITISASDIDADLTDWTMVFDQDFAAVLSQTDGPLDADGAKPMLNDGGDIRFSSDIAGLNRLAVDVRTASTADDPTNGRIECAVKVPAVSSTLDTLIYMWWGRSGVSQPTASDVYGQYNAYDSSFVGVYSLNEDPSSGAPQLLDRTSNTKHATTNGGMGSGDSVLGKIGNQINFDGVDDYVLSPINKADMGSVPTVSFWFSIDSQPSGRGIYQVASALSSGSPFLLLQRENSTNVRWFYNGGYRLNSSVVNGSAYMFSTTYDGTSWRAYKDGVLEGTFPGPLGGSAGSGLYLGNGFNGFSLGKMDEVRISNTNRSAAWLKAEHDNQDNKIDFIVWGGIESVAVESTHLLTKTPAQIISQYLRDELIGVSPAPDAVWPVYISRMPDDQKINDVIAVYDSTGFNDGRSMRTGVTMTHFGIQIMVRSLRYPDGWIKAHAIVGSFETVVRQNVIIGTTTFEIQNISKTTPVVPLGIEESTSAKKGGVKRRDLFSCNFLVTVKELLT